MKELELKQSFRNKLSRMHESELDGLSYETLKECKDMLEPLLNNEKTAPQWQKTNALDMWNKHH